MYVTVLFGPVMMKDISDEWGTNTALLIYFANMLVDHRDTVIKGILVPIPVSFLVVILHRHAIQRTDHNSYSWKFLTYDKHQVTEGGLQLRI